MNQENNTAWITSCKLNESGGYQVNGNMSVPNDPANRHYQDILDWVNAGNLPEGADVVEPDYVALRTGIDGYASTGEQLGMIADGTQAVHVATIKALYPKTITGGVTLAAVPQALLDEAATTGEQLGMIADGTQAAHVATIKALFPKTITGGVTLAAVPQALLDEAATKLFNSQLAAYNTATARLAQYVVSVGREELTEMQATGEQAFNEDTMEMDDVMALVITQSAIEPVEPTVEVTTYSDDIEATPTVSTVTNPLIVTDVAEREAAQAVVDITPSEIKDD